MNENLKGWMNEWINEWMNEWTSYMNYEQDVFRSDEKHFLRFFTRAWRTNWPTADRRTEPLKEVLWKKQGQVCHVDRKTKTFAWPTDQPTNQQTDTTNNNTAFVFLVSRRMSKQQSDRCQDLLESAPRALAHSFEDLASKREQKSPWSGKRWSSIQTKWC